MTLQQSYQPLNDGSDISNKIVAVQNVMDERKRLLDDLRDATKAGDTQAAMAIRVKLFALK